MVGLDRLREAFVTSAQRVAFARCLPEAERRHTGVILTLTASHSARDDLATAAQAFLRLASQRGVHGEAAAVLAVSMAQMAATHVWWRPLYEHACPLVLGHDDTWCSLTELRQIASEIALIAVEAPDALRA